MLTLLPFDWYNVQNFMIYSYIFIPFNISLQQLNMKTLLKFTLVLLVIPITMSAQSNREEVEYIQSIFGMEKKAIVEDFIQLDDASSEAFWTLYDEYEAARKDLGRNRLAILNDYAENYENMSDEKIDELASRSAKQVKSDEALRYKYYNKIKKVAGYKAAAQFYQIEGYFNAAIRMSILESIPFIGELDN